MSGHILEAPFLLIAMPTLQDPNFTKAVILMVEHSHDGSMGFVINRPSTVALSSIIETDNIKMPDNLPAWVGGPVGVNNGLILHSDRDEDPDIRVSENISLSSSAGILSKLVDHYESFDQGDSAGQRLYPYRFLVGYAGWGRGQLDEELRLGAWMQVPLSAELLFDTPWKNIWENAITSVGVHPTSLAPTVQPYLN